jgi:hypothetical protein
MNIYHFELKKKPIPGICARRYCRKPARLQARDKLCHNCRKQVSMFRNPLLHEYHLLKTHAKKRGKLFTLTYSYFDEIAEGQSLKARGLSVDRIDPLRGYEEGNIQLLTLSENSKKGSTEDKARWREHRNSQP